MDVVYLVREGDRNEELRFSLRSLALLSHDRVWIAGYAPTWTSRVGRIPVRQGRGNKYRNGERILEAVLTHPDVSDPFVYMNDDFFVLRELDEVPVLHRGPLVVDLTPPSRAQRPARRPAPRYAAGRRGTAELLVRLGVEDPIAYEPIHTPLPIRREPMLRALELGADVQGLQYRTLYGNLERIGGELSANVKIADSQTLPPPDAPFASTDDHSWARGAVGRYLRDRFRRPSPYERT